jgi:transcriptional regulator with XRE-family HTH domain
MPSRLAHPKDVALGSRLRVMRDQRGISQKVLAARIHVSYQQIQKYEAGSDRIAFSRLCEIADALDVAISDIIEPLLKAKGKLAIETTDLATPQARRMLSAFTRLDGKDRTFILMLTDHLLRRRK